MDKLRKYLASAIFAKLFALACIVYFSLATLGSTGSYLDAVKAAVFMWAMVWLGRWIEGKE